MKTKKLTIFIVDDNLELCEALAHLFQSVGYDVETFQSAQTFLQNHNNRKRGFVIIDVHMPMMNGLDLLEQLKLRKNRLPVMMMTGYGDIGMAVRAMKLGAVDFIEKPFNEQSLLDVVEKHTLNPADTIESEHIYERIQSLSERERQILDLIIEGKLNKEIAYELSISISTVEVHRANVMKKMQTKRLAQLIKLYLQAQFMTELA